MSRTRRFASILCLFAISFLCESASGIEIYVTVENNSGTYPLGKLTIDGSNVTYAEIDPIDPSNNQAYENLTWSDGANAFYSTYAYVDGQTPKTGLATVNQSATPTNINSDIGYFLGLSTDMLNDNLYGYRSADNKLGTFDKGTGAFQPVGNASGIEATGNPGQMAFLNNKFYMATITADGNEFGSLDKTTGAFTNIRTDSFFNQMLLASDGVNLYAIKSKGFQVYSINPANGTETLIGTPTGTSNVWQFFGASTTVPEPGTYILGGISTCLLAVARRRKLRRRHA